MDKIKTTVNIGGKEYQLTGYESEEYIHKVAIYVDRKMAEIRKNFFNLSTTMASVLTAINVADELMKAREEIKELQEKNAALKEEIRLRTTDKTNGVQGSAPPARDSRRTRY